MSKKYFYILIGIVVVLLLGIYFVVVTLLKGEEEDSTNYLPNVEKLDFSKLKNDKRCNGYKKCFSKDNYILGYTEDGKWVLTKKVTKDELNTYRSLNDLALLNKISNETILSKFDSQINNILKLFNDDDNFNMFTTIIDNVILTVNYNQNELKYYISPNKNINYDSYILQSLKANAKTTSDNINTIKNTLYDVSMEENYVYFPHNRIIDYYYELCENQKCKIDILYNMYEFTNYFDIEKDVTYLTFNYNELNTTKENEINLSIEEDNFKKNYIELLEHDIDFFNNYYQSKNELTEKNKKELLKTINNKGAYSITYNNLQINIEYNNDPVIGNVYSIKYSLKK